MSGGFHASKSVLVWTACPMYVPLLTTSVMSGRVAKVSNESSWAATDWDQSVPLVDRHAATQLQAMSPPVVSVSPAAYIVLPLVVASATDEPVKALKEPSS